MTRAPILPLVLALAGCGGELDGGNTPDGGPGSDAGTGCDMVISFPNPAPEAPAQVTVYGDISSYGGLFGAESYSWQVTFDNDPVPFSAHPDGTEVTFDAPETGVYRVVLSGAVGEHACVQDDQELNVLDPGADTTIYRLRFEPAAGHPAPTQENLVPIAGGAAAYTLGTISLESGISVTGQVTGDDSEPLAAYLRFVETGIAPATVEAFAGSSGAFTTRLALGSYDLLAVPADQSIAPLRLTGLVPGASLPVALPPAEAITGTVRDGAGQPVAGARVSLRTGGVPSAIATTDAQGAFTVAARPGGATAVTVVPPVQSGLPRLELDDAAGLVAEAQTPLAIAYAAGLSARAVQPQVVASDGTTPGAGARLTWVLRPIAGAGTVTPEGGAPLSADGRLRIAVTADTGGEVEARSLPDGLYDLIIEPDPAAGTADAAAVVAVDLTAGNPAPSTVQQIAPAQVTGLAVDEQGGPLAGVQVVARPSGLLGGATGGAVIAQSGTDGRFTLPLAAGGSYELVLDQPDGDHALARRAITIPAAGGAHDLGELALPDSVRVTGTVSIPNVGGGAAGVRLVLLCQDCTGLDAVQPVAEALTASDGSFVLRVPDPGTR